jgi:hypothetical protein
MFVSRTALGTPTPTVPRGSASDKTHGLSGVLIHRPSRFSAVFCPHAIEHGKSAFPFGGEQLITVEVDHGNDRFPVLLHYDRVFFTGNPPNQLGKHSFGAFLVHRLSHGQIVEGSYGEVKQRGGCDDAHASLSRRSGRARGWAGEKVACNRGSTSPPVKTK